MRPAVLSKPFKAPFMYEHKKQPLAPPKIYYRRIASNFVLTLLILGGSLSMGTLGFYFTRSTHCDQTIGWLDAFHNASMLLSGMGPIITCYSTAGKIFSSLYALFSGVVFITNVGLILAPAAHRLLHKLHLQEK